VTAWPRGRVDAERGVRHGIGLMRTRTGRLEEVRVAGNRVLGFTGNGVAIDGAVASVAVTDNVIRACAGGVVMSKDSSGDRVSVRSNTILDAAPVADDAFLKGFGIVLVATTDGEILDNSIRFTRARSGIGVPS
jgi:nitrous oxidase accessory protein NosD